MRRLLDRPRLITTALALAAILVAAVPAAARVDGGKVTNLRIIASSPSIQFLPAEVAIKLGFFKKHGLDATITVSNSNQVAALISGDADLNLTTPDLVMLANGQGQPIRVATQLDSHNALQLVVRKDLVTSQMTSSPYPLNVRQLKPPFVIGVAIRGTGVDTFIRPVLEGAGWQENKDWTTVSLGAGANIIAALCANRIDVANLFAPYDQIAVQKGCGTTIVDESKGQGPKDMLARYGASLATTQSWLDTHQAVEKQLQAAITDTLRFMRNPKNENAVIKVAVEWIAGGDQTQAAPIRASFRAFRPNYTTWASCGKLHQHMLLDLKYGFLSGLPACTDIFPSNLPRKDPFATPVKKHTKKK
jgi:NitT/TauT family transport system substrate-binding protein